VKNFFFFFFEKAFENVDIVLAVGSFPRKQGMLRSDLLEKNAPIFKGQALALDKYAKKNVKVSVPSLISCII